MAADVAKDPAVLLAIPEPVRTGSFRADAMRTKSGHMKDTADRTLLDQFTGKDSAFHMETFREIAPIPLSGTFHGLFAGFQLLQRYQRCLVCKIVLAMLHDLDAERRTFASHMSGRDQTRFRIIQDLLFRFCRDRLWELLQECFHLDRIRIIHIFQCAARFRQAIAHSIDVSMIQVCCRENKLSRADDRRRTTFRCIIHTICMLHK